MTVDDLRPLKQALLDEYGHFADRRLKNIDKGSRFIIDDRDGGGPSFGADGTPYGWFCEMFADVETAQPLKVTIKGPLPTGDAVIAWMKANGSNFVEDRYSFRDSRIFVVTPTDKDKLLSLAKALESLIANSGQKRERSDYFVCPRIAASLRRLHQLLDRQWSM
ncbi:MAG: hypothetical protein KGO02_14895 [Alphaproteobacteria bacterium]|nr:hypothetical protein [Alphaproteobacteria bacterium]